MLIGNFIPLPKVFAEGVSSYEFFLKVGIVFMSAKFLITDVARLGGIGLAIVVVEVLFSIGFVNLFSGGSSFLKSEEAFSRWEWASAERRRSLAQRARSTQKRKKRHMR
jgi:uncharacterized membrane protein YadS